MLPAVNGAAYYVSSSYWCGSYQYGCGKGCYYATAANSCYKYDCPAGQSGTVLYSPGQHLLQLPIGEIHACCEPHRLLLLLARAGRKSNFLSSTRTMLIST